MSTLILDRNQEITDFPETTCVGSVVCTSHPSRMDGSGALTLDELITGVWEDLVCKQTVHCPVCSGVMTFYSAPGAASGDCGHCGASLY
jgi:hypothetical protein